MNMKNISIWRRYIEQKYRHDQIHDVIFFAKQFYMELIKRKLFMNWWEKIKIYLKSSMLFENINFWIFRRMW